MIVTDERLKSICADHEEDPEVLAIASELLERRKPKAKWEVARQPDGMIKIRLSTPSLFNARIDCQIEPQTIASANDKRGYLLAMMDRLRREMAQALWKLIDEDWDMLAPGLVKAAFSKAQL